MAWCHQATSHYLSPSWPRSLSPYDITGPQWVNVCITSTYTHLSNTLLQSLSPIVTISSNLNIISILLDQYQHWRMQYFSSTFSLAPKGWLSQHLTDWSSTSVTSFDLIRRHIINVSILTIIYDILSYNLMTHLTIAWSRFCTINVYSDKENGQVSRAFPQPVLSSHRRW